jgi:tRNA (cmo5U34)-methyltransferase
VNNELIVSRFNNAAETYDTKRKLFIPCFDDHYGIVNVFLKKLNKNINSILDIGAGTGLLTNYVKDVFPDAYYKLIDISEKMVEIAKKRFENFVNIEYEINDYVSNYPTGDYDLVISALSIHHINEDNKKILYSKIYQQLTDGGCFITLDQFNAESVQINKIFTESWYDFINSCETGKEDMDAWLQRRELDRENTINETILMLKQNGFKNVECIYQFMKFGVIVAIK